MNALQMQATRAGLVPDWRISDRVRRAREFAELEQEELAEITGISRGTISNYERGRTSPSRASYNLIAMATGVSVEWLRDDFVHPPGLEPGTHCLKDGACIYCGERSDPTYLAPVTRLPQRVTVATPPTSPEGGGALLPERSAAA